MFRTPEATWQSRRLSPRLRGVLLHLMFLLTFLAVLLLSPIPGKTTLASFTAFLAIVVYLLFFWEELDRTTIILSLSVFPYLLWVSASYFWSVDSTQGLTFVFASLTSVLVFLAALWYGRSLGQSRLFSWVILGILSIHIGAAALQYVQTPYLRLTGLTNNANMLAFILLLLWIMISLIGVASRGIFEFSIKLLTLGATIAVLVATASKKAIPGFFLVMLGLWLSSRKTFQRGFLMAASSIVIGGVYITLSLYNNQNSGINLGGFKIFQRFQAFLDGTGEDWVRADMRQEAFRFFLERPLTGYGVDSYAVMGSYGTYSHNNYTELLSGIGIIGVIFFFLPLATSLILQRYSLSALVVILFLLMWEWGAVVTDTKTYWWLLGILLASQPIKDKWRRLD